MLEVGRATPAQFSAPNLWRKSAAGQKAGLVRRSPASVPFFVSLKGAGSASKPSR